MAGGNSVWKLNDKLNEDLVKYVEQNLKRTEILDFVRHDYPEYVLSIPTLYRRLQHFHISYINKTITVDEVRAAVNKELEGPDKLLGYRAMNHKLRTEHHICVPRNLVGEMMWDMDPDGVEQRNVKKKKQIPKKPFRSDGPNWTFSLDRHDKMMGYQNSTFPLAIYGCLDTFSRKIMFLKVWNGNSCPILIGKFYIEYLLDSRTLPIYLRLDQGTETGIIATIHAYLTGKFREFENPVDSVIYGPSTSNKIERWWKDLHERMEKDLKQQLNHLLLSKKYDPMSSSDRKILAYVFIPVLQRECDIFCRMWNSHRVRYQAGLELPTGVPDHMFAFPEKYGGKDKSVEVTYEALLEVADLSHLENAPSDYLEEDERQILSTSLPQPEMLVCKDVADAYEFLRSKHDLI